MSETRKPCVVLGVSGGIAAYKAAELCSRLTQSGYDVRTVMTANALKLISERIFYTLSGHPVETDLFATNDWKPEHVSLAECADLMVVAPATANFIGKLANGIADDALSTTAITHRKPMLLAPAMNANMWNSPALQRNLATLRGDGVKFVGPAVGRLACGTDGIGRMAEPEEIFRAIRELLPLPMK